MAVNAERIAIDNIIIGERRRDDMGNIDTLAESIAQYGLIQPIVVDANNHLVAGYRRLTACIQLGWEEIDVRRYGTLTDDELRELELEENLQRKDLTSLERSKTMVALKLAVKERLSKNGDELLPQSGSNSVGRPKEADSDASLPEHTGIPRTTMQKAEQHVATADAYPFMQSENWKQYHVLEAREKLERLPEEERPQVAAIVDGPFIPPRDAIKILGNLADKTKEERQEIYAMHQSEDSRERSLALTRAAETAPMPDPRDLYLMDVARELKKFIREYPNDAHNPDMRELAARAESVQQKIRDAWRLNSGKPERQSEAAHS